MGDMMKDLQDVYKKWESKPRPPRSGYRVNTSWNSTYGSPKTRRPHTLRPEGMGFGRQNRRHQGIPLAELPKFFGIAQFKMSPTILPTPRTRPFTGLCCSKCLGLSRITIPNPSVSSLCVCNLLLSPYAEIDTVIPKSLLPAYFMCTRKTDFSYPSVSNQVLQCDRVVSSIATAAEFHRNKNDTEKSSDSMDAISIEKINAKRILEGIESSLSPILLRFSSSLVYRLFTRIFKNVQVHKGHIELLTAASKDDAPIVYVPMHRSHMDYALISFILYMSNLKVPLIALGERLFLPLFSVLMKCLGAFCISKRPVHSSPMENKLYDDILQAYVTECLKSCHSLEVFIEGGRSFSGKAQNPKPHLLSFVVDSILKGTIDDVYISTVSISYEKLPEGNFVPQQLGERKTSLTTWSVISSIWKLLHQFCGSVRVDFGQPFSLKEFLKSYNAIPLPEKVCVETPPSSPGSSASSSGSLCGNEHVSSDIRTVVDNLAWHMMYDATFNTALMSTHLVSFLFITKHRKGATESQFLSSFNWLKDELLKRGRDIGFAGDSPNVIKHALTLLGKDMITTETIEMEWTSSDMQNNNVKILFLQPTVKIPHVFELQYYSNNVLPPFLLDSVIVNAVYALLDDEICHFQLCESRLTVSKANLVAKALELCDILRFEFYFILPCAEIASAINEAIDGLVEKECLHPAVGVNQYNTGQKPLTRHANNFTFGSSDEEDDASYLANQQFFKVDLREESIEHLEFLRNILSPYVEAYWLASCTLLHLVSEIKEEKQFLREIQKTAEDRLHKGLLRFEESFAMETLKNTLKLFEFWQVTEHYYENNVKVVYLTENYDCEEKIADVIFRIEEFRN